MFKFNIRTILLITATVAVTIPATRAFDDYRERRLAEEIMEAEVDIAIERARNVSDFVARNEQQSLSEMKLYVSLDSQISRNFEQRVLRRLDEEIARLGDVADLYDREPSGEIVRIP